MASNSTTKHQNLTNDAAVHRLAQSWCVKPPPTNAQPPPTNVQSQLPPPSELNFTIRKQSNDLFTVILSRPSSISLVPVSVCVMVERSEDGGAWLFRAEHFETKYGVDQLGNVHSWIDSLFQLKQQHGASASLLKRISA